MPIPKESPEEYIPFLLWQLKAMKEESKTEKGQEVQRCRPSNLGFRICFLTLSAPCLWLGAASHWEVKQQLGVLPEPQESQSYNNSALSAFSCR